jgi:hypothetical protein
MVNFCKNSTFTSMEALQWSPARLIFKQRRLVFLSACLAALLAAIFSSPWFIQPLYKAEAIIYPPSNSGPRITADYDLRFGSDKETDEHMQILNSSILRDTIILRYRLMNHYDIDSSKTDAYYSLCKEYARKIRIERTQFNSISVSVLDADPGLAAKMANDLVVSGDRIKARIVRKNMLNTYDNLLSQSKSKSEELNRLLQEVLNIPGMNEIANMAVSPGNYNEMLIFSAELQKIISRERFNQRLDNANRLIFIQSLVNEKFEVEKSMYQALINLNGKINQSYLISPAHVPDKKSYPVRWQWVLLFTLSAVVFVSGLVVLAARWKDLRTYLQN